MKSESRRFEVLNPSLEEREVGVSHAKGMKKKKNGLAFKRIKCGFGFNVDSNVIFIFWALR